MKKSSLITESLLEWFDLNRRELPWREVRTAYGTWVSETMLQQTRVATVIPYYKRFLTLFPDISTLAKTPQEEVYKAWEGLGYYSRARNLQKGAHFCLENFNGSLPGNYSGLLCVPGIGPYTAGAIASLAFGLPEPAVDGNVIRVFSRLFGLWIYPQDARSKIEVASLVRELLPEDRAGDFNEAVMDLGATICIPGNPSCNTCPLSTFCEAFIVGIQTELPLRKPKKVSPVVQYTVIILRKGNGIFIRQRPGNGLLANLFEFPTYPGFLSPEDLQDHLSRSFGIISDEITSIIPLGGATHVFSHLKWEMEGFLVELSENKKVSLPLHIAEKQDQGDFYPISEAKKLAFASALKAYTSVIFH